MSKIKNLNFFPWNSLQDGYILHGHKSTLQPVKSILKTSPIFVSREKNSNTTLRVHFEIPKNPKT